MKPSITLLTTLLLAPLAACRSAAEEKAIPEVPVATAAGEKWERQARPLLESFNNVYQPCVAEVGGEWRSRMWFFGSATATGTPGVPSFDAIFHARSKDILNWEVYSQAEIWDRDMNPAKWAPVLHASERWFEEWHIGDPSIVRKDGKFHMAYSTTSKHFTEK